MLLLGGPRVSEPLQQILGLECPSTDLWGAALHTWPQLSDASVHGILLLSATRAASRRWRMHRMSTKEQIDQAQDALLSELRGFKEQLLSRFTLGLGVVLGAWLLADAWLSPPSSAAHLLWVWLLLVLGLTYGASRSGLRRGAFVLVGGALTLAWGLILIFPEGVVVIASAFVLVIICSLMETWLSVVLAGVSWGVGLLAIRLVRPDAPSPSLIISSGLVYALTLGAMLISQSPMREAASLALTAWEQLRSSLMEARERRAELYRVVRALEEATYRIERMNNELLLAQRRADVARQNKARFAAMVSHELRGPLNLILGYSRLLALSPEQYGAPLPPAYRKDVHTIFASSRHVVNLLDDILDLSQLDVDRMPLVKEQIDLVKVAREVEMLVRPLAERKGLGFLIEIDQPSIAVFADRVRVRQVLINLLTNATRFTDRGEIGMRLGVDEQSAQVTVSDTGRGIPAEDLPRLFEEFSQLHLDEEGPGKGSGLGLAISRHLVRLHGGSIRATSEEGVGTEVTFTLPRLSSTHARTQPQGAVTSSDYRLAASDAHDTVLVVHGNPNVVRLIARHLGDYRIIGVPDPETACVAVSDHHPRAIIVDRDLAQGLRDDLVAHELNVPVLVCRLPQSQVSSRLEGVFTFLIKPVSKEALQMTLGQVACRGEELVVLVVDDNPDAVRLLEIMLTSMPEPCRVLRAYDGTQALQAMRRERPDLLLMDLLMPGLGGEDVVREMQSDPDLKTIPVAIVSASDAVEPSASLGDDLGVLMPADVSMAEGLRYLRALLDRVTPEYVTRATTAPPPPGAPRA
jgi:signal transduction histidine kinase